MKLRNASVVALTAGLLSCEGTPPGQVIVVISTDMALRKDIDAIRIVVTRVDSGAEKFDRTYTNFDNPDGDAFIELPATLGLLANEENTATRVRVMAFRGQTTDNPPIPQIRVVREAVLTVPQDRIVTLPMPIEFLCDGFATYTNPDPLKEPNFESICKDGNTCIAGKCADPKVVTGTLKNYDPKLDPNVTSANSATCFDVSACFATPTTLDALDIATCRATLPAALLAVGTFNIGLETEGSGTCNAKGCFVPLDAPTDKGWNVVDEGGGVSTIQLPLAVCEQFSNGKIARVVGAPVGVAPCALKTSSVPLCAVKPADSTQPELIMGGQVNPNALFIDDSGIYWTMQGDLATMSIPGAVKMVPKTGGAPSVIAKTKGVPQGLVLDPRGFVLWSDATGDANGSIGWAKLGVPNQLSTNTLVQGLMQPGGLAVASVMVGGGQTCDQFLAWTEFGGDRVTTRRTCASNGGLNGGIGGGVLDSVPAGVTPFSIDGASLGFSPLFCFGYQGTSGNADGIVACNDSIANTIVAPSLKTPRSLIIHKDALYFAEFDANGAIWRAAHQSGAKFGPAVEIIKPISYPSGLAIDSPATGPILYYTSRDEGSVNAFIVNKGTTENLTRNRNKPSAVAIDGEYVYWLEGTPNMKDGAIFKIKKPALQ